MNNAGYAGLTPSQVLDALDAVGFVPDGRILQLNSYENRVHQAMLEGGGAVVTKFYRPGRWSDAQILEEHAFATELAAAEVPVVAPLVLQARDGGAVNPVGTPATLAHLVGHHGTHRFSVSPRAAGREPELEDPATLAVLGRFIGRLHAVGRQRPFVHRVTMKPQHDGHAAMARLTTLDVVPGDQRPAWQGACERALDACAEAFERHGAYDALRLHGDCHLGNVLWRDGTPHVVDLDDACTGPAVQDLWMLVSGDGPTMQSQLERLVDGYEQFSSFDRRQLRLIEPLRTLRMVRHAAWIAERWDDPAFPAAFGYFGTPAYWSQQAAQLREQIEAMDNV
jgi:Ser/Thr protein kinase RdoA (MazF antagonist)